MIADLLLSFFVPGTPRPKGSWRPITNRHTGRVFLKASDTDREWQNLVSSESRQAVFAAAKGLSSLPTNTHFILDIIFVFSRPLCHFGSGKNSKVMKANAPSYHTKAPDVDKLSRSILDALTGIVYADDSQVVSLESQKIYEGGLALYKAGAYIKVSTMEGS